MPRFMPETGRHYGGRAIVPSESESVNIFRTMLRRKEGDVREAVKLLRDEEPLVFDVLSGKRPAAGVKEAKAYSVEELVEIDAVMGNINDNGYF